MTARSSAGDPTTKPTIKRRGEAILDEIAQRSADSTKARLRRLRYTVVPIVQSAVAAALAWLIASQVVGHVSPFFAPIAAVISLGVSLGQRMRRSVELIVGVAVGVLVADLLIAVIGRGMWQIGVVVALAMAVAVVAGGGPLVVNQAAASGILLVALTPTTQSGMATDRFVDAIIGGVVGIVINALFLPVNPVRVVRRAANRLLDGLTDTLLDLAKALESADPELAKQSLTLARQLEESLDQFDSDLVAGAEIARIAPVRWRMKGHLALYVDAISDIDNATRNIRVLARRSATMLRVGESVHPGLPAAVYRLAEAIRTLRNELAKGWEPRAARLGLVDAAELATATLSSGQGFSANVVVAQIRSTVYDLLLATGLARTDIDRLLDEVEPTKLHRKANTPRPDTSRAPE